MTVRAGAAMPQLYLARFTGTRPRVRVVANEVDVEESRGSLPLSWRLKSAEFALNKSIPWDFDVRGGAWRLTADLRDLRLSMVTVDGGANRVNVRLPHPSGTILIRFGGDASDISVSRPDGVAVRIVVHDSFYGLQVDGKTIEAANRRSFQTAGFARQTDRYDIVVTGAAYRFVITSEPENRQRGPIGR